MTEAKLVVTFVGAATDYEVCWTLVIVYILI